ncbi:hypothetical protein [Thalassovita sp.]|uniref:hypothetical protein n=1 Tax=Thalassovita sp. TaxID=1979401 RepID=UPI002B2768A2|nr:hypothetical protein [Thalassovita sp.]
MEIADFAVTCSDCGTTVKAELGNLACKFHDSDLLSKLDTGRSDCTIADPRWLARDERKNRIQATTEIRQLQIFTRMDNQRPRAI